MCSVIPIIETDVLLSVPVTQLVKNLHASAGDTGAACWTPGSGGPPAGGDSNLLRYSRLENLKDRGAGGFSPWAHKEGDMTERTGTLYLRNI